MKEQEIKAVQKLADEIENFRSCYADEQLFGDVNGEVSYEQFLSYLIRNSHLQEIANRIEDLQKKAGLP